MLRRTLQQFTSMGGRVMSGKATTGLTGLEVDNLVRQKIVQRTALLLRGLETLPEVSGFRESSTQTFTAIKVGIFNSLHLHHDFPQLPSSP